MPTWHFKIAPVKVIIKQTYTVTKNTTVIKDENGNVTSTS